MATNAIFHFCKYFLKKFAGHSSNFIRLNVTVPLCANCLVMPLATRASRRSDHKQGYKGNIFGEVRLGSGCSSMRVCVSALIA